MKSSVLFPHLFSAIQSNKWPYFQHFINGNWVSSVSQEVFESLNPTSNQTWATVARGKKEDIASAVHAANQAFHHGPWSNMAGTQRAEMLFRLADLIHEHAHELAQVEVLDIGKLKSEILGVVKSLPAIYRYYAGLADKIQGEVIPSEKPHHFNFTQKEPYGACALIIPWNSPLLVTSWKLAPLLASGNTAVIKPSEHAPISLLFLAKLIQLANFPPGVVNVVNGFGAEAGESLAQHPLIRRISFTGGDALGAHIASSAALQHKGTLLELGGKSPNIVFEDANLDNAVNGAMAGIFAAGGQSCIAGSRLFLHKKIYQPFMQLFLQRTKEIRLGDPMLDETQMGPICNPQQLQKIQNYVQIARSEGAKLALGGEISPLGGLYFLPTIFTDVKNHMRIAREEVFGPISSVITFESDDEVLELANDTPYGLAAGIWTQDQSRMFHFIKKLQAGTVWVNTYRTLSYMSPFGGFKASGQGRECGIKAMDEFLQNKSVWIHYGEKIHSPFTMR